MNNFKIGTVIDTKYFLKSIVDEKEQATTYKAWHTGWEVPLVINITRSSQTKEMKNRLKSQAKQWIDLGVHPNIVSAYFYREIEDRLFLFLESIHGTSLTHIKERVGKNIPQALAIALEVAKGIEFLHDEGLTHGNLCMDSLIVDKYGRVRISNIRWESSESLDMVTKGLRSLYQNNYLEKLSPEALRTIAIDKLAYKPPEYFLNKSNGGEIKKCDSFAFGVILFELFMNQKPFHIEQETEKLFLAYKKLYQEKHKLQFPGNIPQELISVIEKCLTIDPQKRLKSFSEIIRRLNTAYEEITGYPYVYETWNDNTLLAMSLNNQALGYIDKGDMNEAEKILQEVRHLDTYNIIAPLNLNLLRLRTQKITQKEFLEKIEKYRILENSKIYLFEGKTCLEYGSFIQQAFDNISECEEHDGRLELLKAELNYRLGSYQQARDIYKRQVKRSSNQDLWYKLGAASLELKLNKDARKNWEIGLKQSVPLWDLIVGYSMLLSIEGKWANARNTIDQAMQQSSKYIRHRIPPSTWSHVRSLKTFGDSTIIHIALSKDKKHIFARTEDGNSHIWKWPSGEIHIDNSLKLPNPKSTTRRLFKRLITRGVNDIAIDSNGCMGVTVHGDKYPQVWNMKSGEKLHKLKGHTGSVTAVAITTDGKMALSGSMDKTLRLWDVKSGECKGILSGHTDIINCISVSEEKNIAISGGWDKKIYVWDLEKLECLSVFNGKQDIIALSLSGNAKFAVSGDMGKNVKIWDLENQTCMGALQGHTSSITGVAISHDGQLVISCGLDGIVSVYEDIAKRPCPCWVQSTYALENLPAPPPLNERQENQDIERKLKKHIQNEQFSLALKYYKTLLRKKKHFINFKISEKIFQLAKKEAMKKTMVIGHDLAISFIHSHPVIAFTIPGDDFCFSICEAGTLKRWYFSDKSSAVYWSKPSFEIQCLDMTPDYKTFCFSGKDGILHLWRRETDFWGAIEGHHIGINCLKVSSDGKYVLTGSADGAIQYWDLTNGHIISNWQAHQDMITDLIIHDEDTAISSSIDGMIKFWSLRTFKCTMQMQQRCRPILSLAPAKAKIISAGIDGTIRQWDTNGLCSSIIKAHKDAISALYVRGSLVVSGGKDGRIKLWNLKTRKCLLDIQAHEDVITQVKMSNDTEWIFSSSRDKTLKIWQLRWQWDKKE